MSNPDLQAEKPVDCEVDAGGDADQTARGINLWVVYGLMLVGFLVAIGIAILIVMPFYHRR